MLHDREMEERGEIELERISPTGVDICVMEKYVDHVRPHSVCSSRHGTNYPRWSISAIKNCDTT